MILLGDDDALIKIVTFDDHLSSILTQGLLITSAKEVGRRYIIYQYNVYYFPLQYFLEESIRCYYLRQGSWSEVIFWTALVWFTR